MPALRAIVVLFFALAAGCAGIDEAPQSTAAAAPPPPLPAEAPALEPQPEEVVRIEPLPEAPVLAPAADLQGEAQAATPSVRSPAKMAVARPAIEPLRKTVELAGVAPAPEPSLDIAALKAGLRNTNAFGVFTKLALKNQMDDLLERFRAHYQSGRQSGVAALRQPYDTLVFKVLALLKDGDPPLARTISGSREAIWRILADPEQFRLAS